MYERMPDQELNLDLLVRHPAPFPTESLLGYILRLTQENGYSTPWGVLKLARMSQHDFERLGLKVAKLARVVGRSAAELDRLAYSPPEGHPRLVC
jgi:hypothetical protein